MKYMVTFIGNGFNGNDIEYCDTMKEVNEIATTKYKRTGFIPEHVYKYNPVTKEYDIFAGSFKRI